MYVAHLDAQGELVSAVNDMPNVGGIRGDHLIEAVFLADGAKLVVADCNVPAESLETLAEVLGDILLVEPVSDHKTSKLKHLMNKVAYATPNLSQLGVLSSKKSAEAACRELQKSQIGQVIVNAGPAGAFYLKDDVYKNVPPRVFGKIVDVTGAGDASVAGLVCGLVRELPLAECVHLGQLAAGMIASSYNSALDRDQAKKVRDMAGLA
jgi:pseudouridine kinase